MEESLKNVRMSTKENISAETQAGPGVNAGQSDNFKMAILRSFDIRETDIRRYSPLALAFLGDAVYTLIIRTAVVAEGNKPAGALHTECAHLVSAPAQCRVGRAIADLLNPTEAAVYKRGRNANPPHHSRNAAAEEYYEATALETLCGYLYLQNQTDRILFLIQKGLERIQQHGEETK